MSFCMQGGRRVARCERLECVVPGCRGDERIVKRITFKVDPVCTGALGYQDMQV